MDSDEAPVAGAAPQRGYVRFSATAAREVCRRTAAGETQAEICADPAMPSQASLYRWSKQRAGFARVFARARALGCRTVNGRAAFFCPVAANEIVARVSEGEMRRSPRTCAWRARPWRNGSATWAGSWPWRRRRKPLS